MDELPADKAKNGRPTAYNEELAAKIIDAVRSGLTLERASEYVGMNPGTVQGWTTKRPSFGRLVKKARREHEVSLLRSVELAGEKSWQARAWMLERVFQYAQPSSRLSVDTSITHNAGQGFAQLIAGLASRRAEKKAQVIEAEEVRAIEDAKNVSLQINKVDKYNTYCATNNSIDSQQLVKVKNSRHKAMKRRKPRAESLAKHPPTTTPPAQPPAAI